MSGEDTRTLTPEEWADRSSFDGVSRKRLVTLLMDSRRRQVAQGERIASWKARALAAEAALAEVDRPGINGDIVAKAQAAIRAHNARRPNRNTVEFRAWQTEREALLAAEQRAIAIKREARFGREADRPTRPCSSPETHWPHWWDSGMSWCPGKPPAPSVPTEEEDPR